MMIIRSKYVGFVLVTFAGLAASGCAWLDPEAFSDSRRMTLGAGTPVPAAAETVAVGTTRADAADDPEIWVDPTDPTLARVTLRDGRSHREAVLIYQDGLNLKTSTSAHPAPGGTLTAEERTGTASIASASSTAPKRSRSPA